MVHRIKGSPATVLHPTSIINWPVEILRGLWATCGSLIFNSTQDNVTTPEFQRQLHGKQARLNLPCCTSRAIRWLISLVLHDSRAHNMSYDTGKIGLAARHSLGRVRPIGCAGVVPLWFFSSALATAEGIALGASGIQPPTSRHRGNPSNCGRQPRPLPSSPNPFWTNELTYH